MSRIGIGDNEDFSSMEELDGDDVRIKDASGRPASRDIVQFVPMRNFGSKDYIALAREVTVLVWHSIPQFLNIALCLH